ncbi:MAG: hypothetical protein JSS76_16605 [Bacteroidetes bacterium]|nr:hypothetical protein [Bacteroidota bacterium]
MKKPIKGRSYRRIIERAVEGHKDSKYLKPATLIWWIKNKFNPVQFSRALANVPLDIFESTHKHLLPRRIKDIGKSPYASSTNIYAEITWAYYVFLIYQDELNQYIVLKNGIEKAICLNDFKLAVNLLDELETVVGYSLWSLEKRFYIYSIDKNPVRNNWIIKELLENKNRLALIIGYYTKAKFDAALSHSRYEEDVINIINRHKDKSIRRFLAYKLLFFKNTEVTNYHDNIALDGDNSLIDYYETFVNMLQLYSISIIDKQDEKLKLVETNFQFIVEKIRDNRLKNILRFNSDDYSQIELSQIDADIIANYLSDSYADCITLLKRAILAKPLCFEYYTLIVHCAIKSHENITGNYLGRNLCSEILFDVYKTQKDTLDPETLFVKAPKKSYTLGITELSIGYYNYFLNEFPQEEILDKWNYLRLLNQDNPLLDFLTTVKNISNFSFTNTAITNTIRSVLVAGDNKPIETHNTALLDFGSKSILLIKRLYKQKLYRECIDLIDIFVKQQQSSLNHFPDILIIKKNILVSQKEFIAASELIVEAILEKPNLKFKLFDERVISKLLEFSDYEIEQSISTPILLHMMDQKLDSLWIPFDNFLSCHGLNYPSEVLALRDTVSYEKLCYFMQFVCVKDVFYSSWRFSNQDELDAERIKVLLQLEELDSNNRGIYKEERAIVERDIQIRQALSHIDSKIYVDTKSIQKILNDKLLESLDRYIELKNREPSLNELLKKIEATVVYIKPKEEGEGDALDFEYEKMSKYDDHRYKLFKQMFFLIRDEFISSNDHGIDSYLSMRVRHGTLLGQIRSIFDKHNFITKKDDLTGAYLPNEFWSKKLSTDSNRKRLQNIFSTFSKNVDTLSDDLRKNRLQIKTDENKSPALFDFSFKDEELYTLYESSFFEISNVSDFFSKIFEILWVKTEEILALVREYINVTVVGQLSEQIRILDTSIETLIDNNGNELKEFHSEIAACSTDMSVEFGKIANWFKRVSNKKIEPFDIKLPIDLSLEILKRRNPGYLNVNVSIVIIDHVEIDGDYLPQFTDLIRNLIENIIDHSELDPINLRVDITASLSNNRLNLKIVSNFSPAKDISLLNKEINDTSQTLRLATDEKKRTAKEGKTGYLKIKKILRHDFHCGNDYDINIHKVDEQRIFTTEITFNASHILYSK